VGFSSLALSYLEMDMCILSSLDSQWREISLLGAQVPQSVLDYALGLDETHLDSLASRSVRVVKVFNQYLTL